MILIVEDEQVARKALSLLLKSKGYETAAVETAEEALQVVEKEGKPEVALVDLNLPGMSGMEFLQALARHHPAVPSVLMTASATERGELTPGAGVDFAYLRKPVDFAQLLTLIRESKQGEADA
jgi:CheY-like chemotaxis protein